MRYEKSGPLANVLREKMLFSPIVFIFSAFYQHRFDGFSFNRNGSERFRVTTTRKSFELTIPIVRNVG